MTDVARVILDPVDGIGVAVRVGVAVGVAVNVTSSGSGFRISVRRG